MFSKLQLNFQIFIFMELLKLSFSRKNGGWSVEIVAKVLGLEADITTR